MKRLRMATLQQQVLLHGAGAAAGGGHYQTGASGFVSTTGGGGGRFFSDGIISRSWGSVGSCDFQRHATKLPSSSPSFILPSDSVSGSSEGPSGLLSASQRRAAATIEGNSKRFISTTSTTAGAPSPSSSSSLETATTSAVAANGSSNKYTGGGGGGAVGSGGINGSGGNFFSSSLRKLKPLSGYWLLADLDGTLIPTPHKAQGHYTSLKDGPTFPFLSEWLQLGGNVCVVTTADDRAIKQVFHPLRSVLKEIAESEQKQQEGEKSPSSSSSSSSGVLRSKLLVSMYTGAVLYEACTKNVNNVGGGGGGVSSSNSPSSSWSTTSTSNQSSSLATAAAPAAPPLKPAVCISTEVILKEVQGYTTLHNTLIAEDSTRQLVTLISNIYCTFFQDILLHDETPLRLLSNRYQQLWIVILRRLIRLVRKQEEEEEEAAVKNKHLYHGTDPEVVAAALARRNAGTIRRLVAEIEREAEKVSSKTGTVTPESPPSAATAPTANPTNGNASNNTHHSSFGSLASDFGLKKKIVQYLWDNQDLLLKWGIIRVERSGKSGESARNASTTFSSAACPTPSVPAASTTPTARATSSLTKTPEEIMRNIKQHQAKARFLFGPTDDATKELKNSSSSGTGGSGNDDDVNHHAGSGGGGSGGGGLTLEMKPEESGGVGARTNSNNNRTSSGGNSGKGNSAAGGGGFYDIGGVAQVIIVSLPMAVYETYFTPDHLDSICGEFGLQPTPQPNSVVFSRIGVHKGTVVSHLAGIGKSLRGSHVGEDELETSSSSSAIVPKYWHSVDLHKAVALGDTPYTGDRELTCYPPMVFVSLQSVHHRVVVQHSGGGKRKKRDNNTSTNTAAPSSSTPVSNSTTNGSNILYVGGEEVGGASFLSALLVEIKMKVGEVIDSKKGDHRIDDESQIITTTPSSSSSGLLTVPMFAQCIRRAQGRAKDSWNLLSRL